MNGRNHLTIYASHDTVDMMNVRKDATNPMQNRNYSLYEWFPREEEKTIGNF